jgi:hypothetical protein
MDTFTNVSKEALFYSTFILAGTMFVFKKLFGRRKVNKDFFDDKKKKLTRRSKLFFKNLKEKINIKSEIHKQEDEIDLLNNKYAKMKQFVKQISSQFGKLNEKDTNEKDFSKIQNSIKGTKKDQIFYYLLNNISTMMTPNQNEKC